MSLKLQVYAVKGALQHLLNMVDKPAQLLDNAVMKGLNFCHFCMGSMEPTVFLKKLLALSFNLLKYQPLCVSHDSKKNPMHGYWQDFRCYDQ